MPGGHLFCKGEVVHYKDMVQSDTQACWNKVLWKGYEFTEV